MPSLVDITSKQEMVFLCDTAPKRCMMATAGARGATVGVAQCRATIDALVECWAQLEATAETLNFSSFCWPAGLPPMGIRRASNAHPMGSGPALVAPLHKQAKQAKPSGFPQSMEAAWTTQRDAPAPWNAKSWLSLGTPYSGINHAATPW